MALTVVCDGEDEIELEEEDGDAVNGREVDDGEEEEVTLRPKQSQPKLNPAGGKEHKDITSSLQLGKTLKIGEDTFEDLDEVGMITEMVVAAHVACLGLWWPWTKARLIQAGMRDNILVTLGMMVGANLQVLRFKTRRQRMGCWSFWVGSLLTTELVEGHKLTMDVYY